MNFSFSRHSLSKRERFFERFFEILPGTASWIVLIGMSVLSFAQPLIAALLIIAFNFYWFLRLFYMTIFLVLSYLRLSFEKHTPWMELIDVLRLPETGRGPAVSNIASVGFKERCMRRRYYRQIRSLKKRGEYVPSPDQIYHVVLIPVLRETKTVIEPSILSLVQSNYPSGRILAVLAVEERAANKVKEDAEEMQRKYRGHFLDFLVIVHPDGLPGEARVKGANSTYAARRAAAYFQAKNIPLDNIVLSCFDADTVVHPDYFACLTYHFLVNPQRTRASFQPIPVYHNNIWDAPAFSRLLDIGSSFFQLIEATNPEKLVTFSSHSLSFKALVDADYWPVDMISDDSAIFWKALVRFDGNYRVIPMYVTVSMDVVDAGSWRKTALNVYKQKRRWAWGVEIFPILMRAFLKSRTISFYRKARYTLKLFEGHVSWVTWPFLLAVIGWIPAIVASREFSSTVLYYNAPRISTTIFHLASLSLLITIILSISLLPTQKVKNPLRKKLLHAGEWVLVPFISIFFSAIPALDAQTRLMLGKYMEFSVTEKRRKPSPKI